MRFVVVVVFLSACGGAETRDSDPPRPIEIQHAGVDGQIAEHLHELAIRGRESVERMFAAMMQAPFTLRVFASRAELDAHWRVEWDMPDFQSQCWMVASGGERELVVLSPDAWASEACEHDAGNERRIALLIAHEVVHVFHHQVHPRDSFDGFEPIGWFVEGVAVFASGQLESDHLATAADAIAEGAAPTELESAWSGKYRYGVSGSLVAYIDTRWGRDVLLELMTMSTEDEILARLAISEHELLDVWRRWVVEA
jgi:hypothetical protein